MPAYNVLVHKLPRANFYLLRALACYLIKVVNKSEINLMGVRNVCIVFSPTLNIPTPIFSLFLTEFDAIFGEIQEDASISAFEVTESAALTPEDIRSPRRQMFSDIPTPSYNQEVFAHNQQASSLEQEISGVQKDQDVGFIPMQPAYNNPGSALYSQVPQAGSVTVPGPEYSVARPRNLVPGGPAKARRRESSMLLVGSAPNKNSVPLMSHGEQVFPTLRV